MNNRLHPILYYIFHFFRAKRNGHGIHSPFAYQLCEEVFYNKNVFYDFRSLKSIRSDLLRDETELLTEDFGAGSRIFKTPSRKVKDLALKGISTTQQSELLYRLMNLLKCRNAIELGTSLGLNTLYLAKVNKDSNITTIEGSKGLYDFSWNLAKKNNVSNIRFIHGTFDEVLPKVLNEQPKIDLLYVDGNHRYDATLRYFELALKKAHNDSVFIFDDVYWSKGMTQAWEQIKKHPSVTLSIDTFYFGMIFFKKEIKEKVDLRFYI